MPATTRPNQLRNAGSATYPIFDAPAPDGYLHLAHEPHWRDYNNWLDEGFEGIIKKQHALTYKALALEAKREPHFLELYGNDQARRSRAVEFVQTLTDDMLENPKRAALQNKIMCVLADRPGLDINVGTFLRTRGERWQRLAERAGKPAPTGFRAYRGDHSIEDVLDVAYAWKYDQTLSRLAKGFVGSWSLEPDTAQHFSELSGAQHPGVIYAADIPFDLTYADKLVDGSAFINPYWHQNEIVCGGVDPYSIACRADLTLVRYQGVVYTQKQSQALLQKLERNGQRVG